jgi:hypothetical protein
VRAPPLLRAGLRRKDFDSTVSYTARLRRP